MTSQRAFELTNSLLTDLQSRKLGPALAAGCTAVVKAPPETPLSALALAALIEQAGFPKGVVNVLTTNKNTVDVGYEMTTNSDVRKVSFTGSSPVGALLMKQASGTLKKYVPYTAFSYLTESRLTTARAPNQVLVRAGRKRHLRRLCRRRHSQGR